MTSSELEELRSVCDRIAIINEGRVSGILPACSPAEEFGLLMLGHVGEGLANLSPQGTAGADHERNCSHSLKTQDGPG